MNQPQSESNPLAPLMVLVGPIAAFMFYVMVLGHPLDAPDLDFITDDPGASAVFPAGQAWMAPTPPERPDLAIYRPIWSTLLKIQYELWPARINLIRTTSLFLFVAAALFFSLLVTRLLKNDISRAAAMILFVVHPMMTEANALLSAQGLLVALAAWMAALWVYQLHLEAKLPLIATAGIVGVLFALAFGAYEAALLMPLSLVAMEFLSPRHESDQSAVASRGERLLIIGTPMLAVAILLFILRLIALDGQLAPDITVRGLDDASIFSRIASAPSAIALGILKVFIPLSQSFFYAPAYGGSIPIWFALPLLVGFALVFVAAAVQSRTAAVGLALALIPLLAFVQIFPLTVFFAERMLAFCIPGIAIAFGDLAGRVAPVGLSNNPSQRTKVIRIALGIVLVLCVVISIRRNIQWGNPDAHWAAEARGNPSSPEPLTMQLISMVSRPAAGLDPTAIRRASEDALKLAKGSDADPVYSYLALYYMQTGNSAAARNLLEAALQQDRPMRYGTLSGLGTVANAFGLIDLAEPALMREHERWPGDFNNLFALSELYGQKGDFQKSLDFAHLAAGRAPSHMEASVQLRIGEAAIMVPGREPEGLAALAATTRLVPELARPYMLTAQHYDKVGEYSKLELTLQTALRNVRMESCVDLASIQAESYERRGNIEAAGQFLVSLSEARQEDLPLLFYTARFMLDHRYYDVAERFYRIALSQSQTHPVGIYGLARIAMERDGQLEIAERALGELLRTNPDYTDASTLLAQVQTRMAAAAQAATQTPESTESAPGENPALAPSPVN